MPTRLPKADNDAEVWGMVLNDALRVVLDGGLIYVVQNANLPPTVKAGSRFFVYKTDTYTPAAVPASGNNAYPNSVSATYNASEAVSEAVDRAFAWNAGSFPVISDGTWYLFCSGATDATKLNGDYGATKTAPTYDPIKGGWYQGANRCLASFVVASSVVSAVTVLKRLSDDITTVNATTVNATTVNATTANATTMNSGTEIITGLLDISGAAAGQIKFPATQNASSNANTLDDYEEGTWTPVATGQTQAVTFANYTKIGRLVTVRVLMTVSTNNTQRAQITGLPFTSSSTGGAAITIYYTNYNPTGIVRGYINASSSTIIIDDVTVAGVLTSGNFSRITPNATFFITATYEI